MIGFFMADKQAVKSGFMRVKHYQNHVLVYLHLFAIHPLLRLLAEKMNCLEYSGNLDR
jgi:hypothetical protein